MYLQNLITLSHYLPFFLKGFWVTVWLSAICLVLATLTGLVVGTLHQLAWKPVRLLITGYIHVIRGTPFLVQLFIIFFLLPELIGLELSPLPSAIVGLLIHGTAYIAAIFSAGVASIARGQWEATASQGLTLLQTLRHVVFPQIFRFVLPPLVGQYVLLIKDTTVVSIIGVTELTKSGLLISSRVPEGITIFSVIAAFYFFICYPLVSLAKRLEQQLSPETRNG